MCNKCNQNNNHNSHNNCGCTEVEEVTYICNECQPTAPCDCAVKDLSTDCIIYTGDDLECSEIKKNTILTELIQQLDAFICKLKDDIANLLVLVNIGTGAKVYAGDNLLGNKKLRTINKSGDLITVTEATEEIVIGFDEDELENTIINLMPNYNAENVGTGADVFKEEVANTFRFRTLLGDSQTGVGASVLRDVQENTNDVTFRFKKLKSNSISISETDDEITLEATDLVQIPSLYVNNAYVPNYNQWLAENRIQNGGTAVTGFVFRGKGTLSQPFTDSTVYPLAGGSPTITPNTAIQNALDGDTAYSTPYSFVGTSTKLAPQRVGQKIIVQDNNSSYTFNGNFNYNNLYIVLNRNVLCNTTNYLVDMDDSTTIEPVNGRVTIQVEGDVVLQCVDSLGFNNSGNTEVTPPSYTSGRTLNLLGEGAIYFSYNGLDNTKRYILNTDGNNNDDSLHFFVKCQLIANNQGIYFMQNKGRVDFYNRLQSGLLGGTGNLYLKAFHMTGGQVRFFEKGSVYIGNETTGRQYGFTFNPIEAGVGYCLFQLNSAIVSGTSNYCFAKLNSEVVNVLIYGSNSNSGFSTTTPGTNTIVNGLFENLGTSKWNTIEFRNNIFSFTGIDQTKVDLTMSNTMSVSNSIGGNIIENLVTRDDRAAALASLPLYSAYLKTNGTAYPNTSTWTRDIVLPS